MKTKREEKSYQEVEKNERFYFNFSFGALLTDLPNRILQVCPIPKTHSLEAGTELNGC